MVALMSLIGSNMSPSVNDFDVSGLRFGFVVWSPGTFTTHCPWKFPAAEGLPGCGQRRGSAEEPAKNVWPDCPFSDGPGARKPPEAVPLIANSGIGVNLKPTFGLARPPDRL